MYAPVAVRCLSYELPLSPLASCYRDTVLADDLLQDWMRAATAETQLIESEEVGR